MNGRSRLSLGIVCAIFFFGGLWLRFHAAPPVPRRPSGPAPANAASLTSLDYSQGLYAAQLVKDSKELGVGETKPDDLSGVLPYDLAEPHAPLALDGQKIETRDLR